MHCFERYISIYHPELFTLKSYFLETPSNEKSKSSFPLYNATFVS